MGSAVPIVRIRASSSCCHPRVVTCYHLRDATSCDRHHGQYLASPVRHQTKTESAPDNGPLVLDEERWIHGSSSRAHGIDGVQGEEVEHLA